MYQFNDDTLIHGIGFDFCKLESIFKNGILSKNEASKIKIPYERNYHGKNNDDFISMIRYIYVNDDDINSAYNLYVRNGIGFIVENTPYIYDKSIEEFHRSDEVYVKSRIEPKNIKGLIIYDDSISKDITEQKILPVNSVSYVYIKHVCDNIINYLKDYNYTVDSNKYNNYLRIMYFISGVYREAQDDLFKTSLKEEFQRVVLELNSFIGECYKKAFSKYLNKEDINAYDIIDYLNHKYHNVTIYHADKIRKMI